MTLIEKPQHLSTLWCVWGAGGKDDRIYLLQYRCVHIVDVYLQTSSQEAKNIYI